MSFISTSEKQNSNYRTWSCAALEHCEHSVYLGVTFDRSLFLKTHIEKTKRNVCLRNNILSKLTGTTWGAYPQIQKSTALLLCYPSDEYACPARLEMVRIREEELLCFQHLLPTDHRMSTSNTLAYRFWQG